MTTSFQADIRPLFTERDIHGMSRRSTWRAMMKLKHTQPLFMTAFAELVAPLCRPRRQGAKADGRNPALICSLNGWRKAVHLKAQ